LVAAGLAVSILEANEIGIPIYDQGCRNRKYAGRFIYASTNAALLGRSGTDLKPV